MSSIRGIIKDGIGFGLDSVFDTGRAASDPANEQYIARQEAGRRASIGRITLTDPDQATTPWDSWHLPAFPMAADPAMPVAIDLQNYRPYHADDIDDQPTDFLGFPASLKGTRGLMSRLCMTTQGEAAATVNILAYQAIADAIVPQTIAPDVDRMAASFYLAVDRSKTIHQTALRLTQGPDVRLWSDTRRTEQALVTDWRIRRAYAQHRGMLEADVAGIYASRDQASVAKQALKQIHQANHRLAKLGVDQDDLATSINRAIQNLWPDKRLP